MSEISRTSSHNPKLAGAAFRDITPRNSQFLYGYPHVERMSTGVHDPLLASALYLNDGESEVLFIAVDLLFVTKQLVATARERINKAVGIPRNSILISATHTHSAPITMCMLSNAEDKSVPEPDPRYVAHVLQGITEAAVSAVDSAQPAQLGWEIKQVDGLGTNRHDPSGPSFQDVPVLVVRAESNQELIGVMCVCSMHPTVLHEDSKQVSGDFPGCAREYLREQVGDPELCIVYHMGAAGNQSPRHVVQSNTFAEAERLGKILGDELLSAIEGAECMSNWQIGCESTEISLPVRQFPTVADAELGLQNAVERLAELADSGADRASVRTAECDLFGAQETLTLSRECERGHFASTVRACMPAEIQVIHVGPWVFVGWPGEVFTEYALELREQFSNVFMITIANGELQGYLVTGQAVENRTYEASNAVFQSPEAPKLLLAATQKILEESLELAR
jgi:neutral ceramidase